MTKYKYHIVTKSSDSGQDSKQDVDDLVEAVRLAKNWLADPCYHTAYIYYGANLIKQYSKVNNKIINIKINTK